MALLRVGVDVLNSMATLVGVLGINPFVILGIVKEFGKSLEKR
jgi:hypothetical protein